MTDIGGEMSAKQKLHALMEELDMTQDEAAHMLVDMGECTVAEHEELLTEDERRRVYG